MLTPPGLSDDIITACVHEHFGFRIAHVAFLPIGADVNSAVYRVTATDGTQYLLKLRRGHFKEVAVTVPALLHAHGLHHVMAPIATTTHDWWVQTQGFAWMLYPFFAGKNGFEVPLSSAQWVAFGATMRAVHTTRLPTEVEARVPREVYSAHWRQSVQAFHHQVGRREYNDPIAACFAAFWMTKRDEIYELVARTEQLAEALQQRAVDLVVCHADLHGGNVLLGANDALAIVDWDELILAPKERDLMFVGAGIGGVWDTADEERLFYQGYGTTAIDPVMLAYYRYERVVADIAAYAEQIFGIQGSAEDREQGLHQLMGQFQPDSVVPIAHRTYSSLA